MWILFTYYIMPQDANISYLISTSQTFRHIRNRLSEITHCRLNIDDFFNRMEKFVRAI